MSSLLAAAHAVDPPPPEVRARALEALKVDVGHPEQRFTRLTQLARLVFDVPTATVTLLDGETFWIKAADGLDLTCYPRVDSFCDATVRLRRPLVVPDTAADPRFRDLHWVTGESNIRFYAGAPIQDADGLVVGTFCVLGSQPREFGDRELAILVELADWARQELTASDETTRAREVQQQLLPEQRPQLTGYDIRGVCIPSRSVGGDGFDWGRSGEGLALMLSDVMGKGAGAAILSATVRSAVRAAATAAFEGGHRRFDIARLVGDVDRALRPDLERTSSLVTAFFAHLDAASNELSWVDAGHGLALLLAPGADPVRLSGDHLPLGMGETGWTAQRTLVPPGGRVVVFSDGLLDLLGGDREAFHAVGELARSARDADDLVATVGRVAEAMIPVDDVTAVALVRHGEPTTGGGTAP